MMPCTCDHFAVNPASARVKLVVDGLRIGETGVSPVPLVWTLTPMPAMNDGGEIMLPFCRFLYTQLTDTRLSLASTLTVGNTTTKDALALKGGRVKVRVWPL